VYKCEDPQVSTDVQRAWLYSKDGAINSYQKGKVDQKLKMDNETSLQMGDGARANFTLSCEDNFYRHKRCEITNIKNQVLTKK